jgi:hypothetical protein
VDLGRGRSNLNIKVHMPTSKKTHQMRISRHQEIRDKNKELIIHYHCQSSVTFTVSVTKDGYIHTIQLHGNSDQQQNSVSTQQPKVLDAAAMCFRFRRERLDDPKLSCTQHQSKMLSSSAGNPAPPVAPHRTLRTASHWRTSKAQPWADAMEMSETVYHDGRLIVNNG